MSTVVKHQPENTTEAKIKALLIQLRDDFGWTGVRIAERCGLSDQYISDLINGKKEAGDQAAATIRILFELESLKAKEPKTIEDHIRAVVREELEKLTSEPIPNEPAMVAGARQLRVPRPPP